MVSVTSVLLLMNDDLLAPLPLLGHQLHCYPKSTELIL